MKKYNQQKDNFIKKFPDITLEQHAEQLSTCIKFNFKYFDNSQKCGQDFHNWNHEQLSKLLVKLKEFSKESIQYWTKHKIGHQGNTVLAIYDCFPIKSDFIHPKHIPLDVQWACFRLESDMRLVGFLIPQNLNFENIILDKNTFYVVFLDENHRFYLK